MTQDPNPGYRRITDLATAAQTAIHHGSAAELALHLTPDVRVFTSHLGDATGAEAAAKMLTAGHRDLDPWFSITNSHVRRSGDDAVQSLYVTGGLRSPLAVFGGHQVLRWRHSTEGWRVSELRFALDWVQTRNSPTSVPGWDLNQRPEVVLSELDAPWHVIPADDPGRDVVAEIKATYIRYAWGIDQQDAGLMAGAFHPDATADMVPFGRMGSGREVVAKLKALRNGQPWMQHSMGHAEVTDLDESAGTAGLRIYRDVPTWDPTPVGRKSRFGAWYEAQLVRDGGTWRFISLVYHPHPVQLPA